MYSSCQGINHPFSLIEIKRWYNRVSVATINKNYLLQNDCTPKVELNYEHRMDQSNCESFGSQDVNDHSIAIRINQLNAPNFPHAIYPSSDSECPKMPLNLYIINVVVLLLHIFQAHDHQSQFSITNSIKSCCSTKECQF